MGNSILRLTLGYSPCPNDTFMFHAIAKGLLKLAGCELQEQLHDVETLNRMATRKRLDVTKISFHAWLKVKDYYRRLESGAALGYGCGPIVISKRAVKRSEIESCCIVLPGELTTAHLLFQLWAPESTNKVFVPYDQIYKCLDSGGADCGVIIHENRFTFEQDGFRAVVDLGAWWEDETGLPIPLACIAAKQTIPDETVRNLEDLIRQSIMLAQRNPEDAFPFIRKHAQEMEEDVLRKHIREFVNEFSLELGETGRAAILALEERARRAGVVS
jgi:1,4-dihydroxy-6-naphthoate synthase